MNGTRLSFSSSFSSPSETPRNHTMSQNKAREGHTRCVDRLQRKTVLGKIIEERKKTKILAKEAERYHKIQQLKERVKSPTTSQHSPKKKEEEELMLLKSYDYENRDKMTKEQSRTARRRALERIKNFKQRKKTGHGSDVEKSREKKGDNVEEGEHENKTSNYLTQDDKEEEEESFLEEDEEYNGEYIKSKEDLKVLSVFCENERPTARKREEKDEKSCEEEQKETSDIHNQVVSGNSNNNDIKEQIEEGGLDRYEEGENETNGPVPEESQDKENIERQNKSDISEKNEKEIRETNVGEIDNKSDSSSIDEDGEINLDGDVVGELL